VKSDIIVFIFGLTLWAIFAIMDVYFSQGNDQRFSKKLISGISKYWIVLLVVWLFYSWHMWSVYDYSPWPLNLVEKL